MDRKSREMLDFMRDEQCVPGGRMHFGPFLASYCEYSKQSVAEIQACMRYLETSGYIKWTRNQTGILLGFCLEHRGRSYEAFAWEDFKAFLFKSILVPIAVSVLTTLITSWLTGLL